MAWKTCMQLKPTPRWGEMWNWKVVMLRSRSARTVATRVHVHNMSSAFRFSLFFACNLKIVTNTLLHDTSHVIVLI
jgi:hypothetical protein